MKGNGPWTHPWARRAPRRTCPREGRDGDGDSGPEHSPQSRVHLIASCAGMTDQNVLKPDRSTARPEQRSWDRRELKGKYQQEAVTPPVSCAGTAGHCLTASMAGATKRSSVASRKRGAPGRLFLSTMSSTFILREFAGCGRCYSAHRLTPASNRTAAPPLAPIAISRLSSARTQRFSIRIAYGLLRQSAPSPSRYR